MRDRPRQWTRPWYRPRNAALAVLVALLCWLGYAVAWALTAGPVITCGPARRMEALAAAAQPPGENAWPLAKELSALVGGAQADASVSGHAVDPATREAFAAVFGRADEEFVAEHQRMATLLRERGASDLLKRAASLPNMVRPRQVRADAPMMFSSMIDAGRLFTLARLRLASMRIALSAPEHNEAVEAMHEAAFVARAYSHQATCLEQLIGWGVARDACRQVREALAEHRLDAPILQRLRALIRDEVAALGPPSLGLEGNKQLYLDVIQRIHADDGRGDGRLLLSQLDEAGLTEVTSVPLLGGRGPVPRIANLAGFLLPGRRETTGLVEQYYGGLIRKSRLPPRARTADAFDPRAFVVRHGPHNFIVPLLAPATEAGLWSHGAARCEIAGTLVVIAIELHRAATGQLPGTLDELVPKHLESPAVDPVSGAGFVYRRSGEDYTLYGVGVDGADDGGKTSPGDPAPALLPRGAGLDFVLHDAAPRAGP
jgi:hypothetical protein